MPGMDPDLVTELKQFLLDTLLDGFKAAPWKIRTADGTCKQGIADENIILSIQRDTARRMARGVDDAQG